MTSSCIVTILTFPDVEVLDFCGPFEVLSAVNELVDPPPFRIQTVAPQAEPIRARGGLRILPDEACERSAPGNILIIPGGHGTHALLSDAETMQWIRDHASRAEIVLSVCTGARLLAAAGLLDGLRATTHHSAIEDLASRTPTATFLADTRFVDEGRIITAAGVSAGIDATLHLIARRLGTNVARKAAQYIEWR